jgi:hypothetical protein
LLVVVAQNPHEVLLVMCVMYSLSGPIAWVYKKQFDPKEAKKNQEKETQG